MTYHACVWIDHRHAKIFRIGATAAETEVISEHGPEHNVHRKADHVGLGTVEMDHDMMREVAEGLSGVEAILITGPGVAKATFKKYLDEHHPKVAEKVWGVHNSDHPTDAQIIAEARSWFRGQDRMH